MRAFVAVEVPPIPWPGPGRHRPEDHVTLQFFADLPEERLAEATGALREAVAGVPPFPLALRGVGSFPPGGPPRVVWAGVGEGAEALSALVARLRRALEARGFPPESRPFVPHLTLFRVREGVGARDARQLLGDPEARAREWARTEVRAVVLKESRLLPTGAEHLVRARAPLATGP